MRRESAHTRKQAANWACRPSGAWMEAALPAAGLRLSPPAGLRKPAAWPCACCRLVAGACWSRQPGSEELEGHFARRINLDLCFHGGVGCGVFICYDQQLVEGRRLVAEKPVLEEGALSAPGSEVLDSLHLVHALAAVPKLGPAREVIAS